MDFAVLLSRPTSELVGAAVIQKLKRIQDKEPRARHFAVTDQMRPKGDPVRG